MLVFLELLVGKSNKVTFFFLPKRFCFMRMFVACVSPVSVDMKSRSALPGGSRICEHGGAENGSERRREALWVCRAGPKKDLVVSFLRLG